MDELGLRVDFEEIGHVFKPQELTNLLYSYARAAHPAPALFAAVAKQIDSGRAAALRGWRVRDICNAMWAYAAADERHFRLIEACCDALTHLAFDWERAHLTQLQQWMVCWEVELQRAAASWAIPELRQRCRSALASGDEANGHTVSELIEARSRRDRAEIARRALANRTGLLP